MKEKKNKNKNILAKFENTAFHKGRCVLSERHLSICLVRFKTLTNTDVCLHPQNISVNSIEFLKEKWLSAFYSIEIKTKDCCVYSFESFRYG